MSTQSFKDLLVWQKAKDLTVNTYITFQAIRDYSFKDQIQRCATSVMNNIAEGHARRSDKAFKNFLGIAKGSAGELESMIILAQELAYINEQKQQQLTKSTQEVSKLLTAFIKRL